jgi:hypothetical protein
MSFNVDEALRARARGEGDEVESREKLFAPLRTSRVCDKNALKRRNFLIDLKASTVKYAAIP